MYTIKTHTHAYRNIYVNIFMFTQFHKFVYNLGLLLHCMLIPVAKAWSFGSMHDVHLQMDTFYWSCLVQSFKTELWLSFLGYTANLILMNFRYLDVRKKFG